MNLSAREQAYFEWLTTLITPTYDRYTYFDLYTRLHETEFVWVERGDHNRVGDARELRYEFAGSAFKRSKRFVSVLEVLIATSRRMAWVSGGDAPFWAWHMIENLGLKKCSDPLSKGKLNRIDDVLNNLIWRTYERNGQGGFFPLREPKEDQRKVEIWYQLNAYSMEIGNPFNVG